MPELVAYALMAVLATWFMVSQVILPTILGKPSFTAFRRNKPVLEQKAAVRSRLDQILEERRAAVLTEIAEKVAMGIDPEDPHIFGSAELQTAALAEADDLEKKAEGFLKKATALRAVVSRAQEVAKSAQPASTGSSQAPVA